jgi:guanylate kinase
MEDGRMIIFTAPSGAGKTTLVRHLLEEYDFLDFSISATTRAKRDHEVDGKDYYFLSKEEFESRKENGEFIEWEEVYEGQYYGTLKSEVDRIWKDGSHAIFDIDVKGATSIKNIFGDKCLSVFVRPPSLEVLIERLKGRKTESESSLRKRIERVRREMTYENSFDVVLVNDLLDVAKKEAEYYTENFLLGLPFIDEEE